MLLPCVSEDEVLGSRDMIDYNPETRAHTFLPGNYHHLNALVVAFHEKTLRQLCDRTPQMQPKAQFSR